MARKSIKKNMVLNAIRGLLSVLFPLITFPYISRVLGVENIGKYNFANSVISYFILLAGLGITTYAVREGARVREDKEKLNQFCNEVFTINMISTFISYLLLLILVLIVPKFMDYSILIWILSLNIIFKTIGIEWIYSIYEDFKYITIRSILFQILSLVCMFLFVKTENDLYIYTLITVLAAVGSNILNLLHSRKYCHLSFTKNINLKKHLTPILVLFATAVTTTIYVSSDITILGFLSNDYHVGIYSVSTKVYTIIKSLIASIIVVSIPRFSALLSQKEDKKFKTLAKKIYKSLITLIVPSIVGIIVLRDEIIYVIAGSKYMDATSSLVLLSITMFFCLGAYFWGQAMLVPFKKENVVLKATIASAIANIVLNLIMIPFWKENAAAFTTLVAEGIAFLWCRHETKKLVDLDSFNGTLIKSLIGSSLIVLTAFIIKQFIHTLLLSTILIVVISVIVYGLSQLLLKNDIILMYLEIGKKKLKKIMKKVKHG